MAPIRPQDHAFVFEASVLVAMRSKLGLNQAELAELLDVPVNTLSRWERGSNVPDANALAALFSICVERGAIPQFFKARKGAIMNRDDRDILVIQWDYQNMALESDDVESLTSEIWDYMEIIFPRMESRKATAYFSVSNWDVREAFRKQGFVTKNSSYNADRHLIQDGEVDFGLSSNSYRKSIDPPQAVYVLISNDGDYADYLGRLKNAGVEVFVCGYTECSERLIRAVGPERLIPWQRPYMTIKCYEVARKLVGKPVSKSAFGNQCRVALEEDGFEGDEYEELLKDTGFSLNRPFASALQHMSTLGILRVKPSVGDPNQVTLTIP